MLDNTSFHDYIAQLDKSDPSKALELLKSVGMVTLNSYDDITGQSLLYYTNNLEICEFLIDNFAQCTLVHQDEWHKGDTALVHSIRNHQPEKAKLIINKCEIVAKDILTLGARRGYSPLHLAVAEDMYDVCELLISKLSGKDIVCQNFDDETPLHWAIRYRRNKIAKLLIDNIDAELLNIGNKDEENPLHVAITTKNRNICKLLISKMSMTGLTNKTKIIRDSYDLASKLDLFEIRDLIWERKRHLNLEDEKESKKYVLLDLENKNILHVAIERNDIGACKFIINKNNNHQFTKDENGDCPLDIAIKKGYKEIEELLRKKLNYTIYE